VHSWWTVREEAFNLQFVLLFMCFHSILLAMCCWLHKVWQIVREVSADGLLRADGLRVGLGRSIFQGAVLEVWEAISDGSQ
jgi:hypothetical protein